MADVLKHATKRSRCKVVGELASMEHVVAGVRWKRADVVLVGLEGGALARPLETALRQCPRLRILAVERNGQRMFAFELQPQRVALGDLSLPELLKTLESLPPRR
jgi:hypothetical protein